MDVKLYLKNRDNFPLEELAKYRGKYVAFSPDGSRIVASAYDLIELNKQVVASGENPEECVMSGIPDCDTIIGGFGLIRQNETAGRSEIEGDN